MPDFPSDLSRQELYDLVWSTPMQHLAKTFNMSDVGLVKICKQMRVPTPGRGHWAKLENGKRSDPEPLPDSFAHDCVVWKSANVYEQWDERLVPFESPLAIDPSRPVVIPRGSVKHIFIETSRPHFDVELTNSHFIKPRKRLVVDLYISEEHKRSAFSVAHLLFATLAKRGYDASLAPHGIRWRRPHPIHSESDEKHWAPQRPTFINVGGMPIGVRILERSEQAPGHYDFDLRRHVRGESPHSRTMGFGPHLHPFPNGVFTICFYAPFADVDWQRIYDTPSTKALRTLLPTVIKEMETAALEMPDMINQAIIVQQERRDERAQQLRKMHLESDERLRQESLRNSEEELRAIIAQWDETQRISRFLEQVETQLSTVPEEQQKQIRDRLQAARGALKQDNALACFAEWQTPAERCAGKLHFPDSNTSSLAPTTTRT